MLQILDFTVISVVLFGDPVQSIDTRGASFQTFFQMRAGSDVLIPWPKKSNASLAQQFLNVEPLSTLTFSCSHLASPSLCHTLDRAWWACPTLANLLAVPGVRSSWPSWVVFLFRL